jgi:predicted GH43/DUF377 family glycosyl hydrolase
MLPKRIIVLNQNQRNYSGSTPPILRGITPQQIKNITEKREKKQVQKTPMARKFKRVASSPGVKLPIPPRPSSKYLTTLVKNDNVKIIPVPEQGSFNPGLVSFDDGYIMAYRPDEYGFKACLLDKDFNIKSDSYFKFDITNCADPRLIWFGSKLILIYSSTEEVGLRNECIRGAVVMDRNHADRFINAKSFNNSLPTAPGRQKNWTPFIHQNKLYLIASICPHLIYELQILDNNNVICEKKWQTNWDHPWFQQEFLRGNTNAVQLEDGNYLNTFHTAVKLGPSMHYYDNGCYVFEGKPPFRVLKCSNRTYLKAEDAVSTHFRKKNLITVCFPVGMVRENEKLFISYGDNDSQVKILKTTVAEMLDLTIEVY